MGKLQKKKTVLTNLTWSKLKSIFIKIVSDAFYLLGITSIQEIYESIQPWISERLFTVRHVHFSKLLVKVMADSVSFLQISWRDFVFMGTNYDDR